MTETSIHNVSRFSVTNVFTNHNVTRFKENLPQRINHISNALYVKREQISNVFNALIIIALSLGWV